MPNVESTSVPPPAPVAVPDAAPSVPMRPDLAAKLRESLTPYVQQRRAANAPLERVIGEVRCLVREAESCEGYADPAEALLRCALEIAADAYEAGARSP